PYRELKWRLTFSCRCSGFGRERSLLGKREISLQHFGSALLDTRFVNIMRLDGCDENELPPCSRERHVEAPFSPFQVYWSEVQRERPCAIPTVADRDNDRVALVALNGLERLDEERFLACAPK